jgi:DedD protein
MSPGSDATIAAANEAKASASKNAAPVAASGGSAATTGAPAQSSSDAEQQGSSAPGNAATHVVAKPDAMPPADAKPARAASSATTKVATSVAISKPTHGGFVVQLAAFSDDKGANALANRLKRGGHPAFTEPVATSRGTLWRVRVGPYASREEADAARDKLKREGQNGIVAARSS